MNGKPDNYPVIRSDLRFLDNVGLMSGFGLSVC